MIINFIPKKTLFVLKILIILLLSYTVYSLILSNKLKNSINDLSKCNTNLQLLNDYYNLNLQELLDTNKKIISANDLIINELK